MEGAYLKILRLQACLQSAPTPYASPELGEESRQGNHILFLPLHALYPPSFWDGCILTELRPLVYLCILYKSLVSWRRSQACEVVSVKADNIHYISRVARAYSIVPFLVSTPK